jgi:uncharacterized membrane protein
MTTKSVSEPSMRTRRPATLRGPGTIGAAVVAVCTALSGETRAATVGTFTQDTLSFATIDVAGATSTVALDINGAGDIVGSYVAAGRTRGYLLERTGLLFLIDYPGAVFTRAAGINARRDIVGTYRLPADPASARHGFLLSEGQFTTIDPPGAVFTNPLGINERGDIVGRYCVTTPCQPESPGVRGFLLSDGEFATIEVPGARGTNAWKINARGDIVGGYTGADGLRHVFLMDGHTRSFATVDVPGVVDTGNDNGGINSRRDIVAVHCDTAPCRGASLDAHGFLLSRGLVTTVDAPGAVATNAFGINERGDVVGVYEDAAGLHGFWLGRR